jgi:hypothetical protein
MSDFDDEPSEFTYLTEEEAKRRDEEMGKINRALLDKEEADLYAQDPGENDSVTMLKIARVMANRHYCEDCRHFHIDERTCDAYPNGIPSRLLSGEFDHILPYEGDHRIRWQSKHYL